jgi:hypothetical protein
MSYSNELKMPKEENYRTQQMLNICEEIPPPPPTNTTDLSPFEPTRAKVIQFIMFKIWKWDFLHAVSEK